LTFFRILELRLEKIISSGYSIFVTTTGRKSSKKNYWSAHVTKHSNALNLETSVFRRKDPKRIAQSLKRSAERSKRRKATPFQSAMSMLTFYINRAGKNLPQSQKKILDRAKKELRIAFHRQK